MKNLIVIFLILACFSGCASSKTIKNDIKTLGMVGTNVETDSPDIATAKIKKDKIIIKSVSEGSAFLFIYNEAADITILELIVSKKGAVSIIDMVEYTDSSTNTILTDTTWAYSDDDGTETLQFSKGTKGIYIFTDTAGSSYSANFSYKMSKNEITFMFVVNGITVSTGLVAGNILHLQIIDDDISNEHTLSFRRIK
jgi:hypothetical protein